jgi:dienelactone hydrolase
MGARSVRRPVLLLLVALAVARVAPAAQPSERVVDLSTADGTKLKATYFDAGRPGPGVILLHQCNRQRKVWDDLARQLSAAGMNILTFDYRGFGESGGEPFDKTPADEEAKIQAQKWPGDIDTAYNYLVSQPGVVKDEIGAGGASCGVNNSIQLAMRHPEIRSLVLLSGPAPLASRQFLRGSPGIPAFFAVADDDEFQPTVLEIEWLYSLDGNPGKRFVHYATGGHGADMFRKHPELRSEIFDWYIITLIKTPGRAPVSKDASPIDQQARALDKLDRSGGVPEVRHMLETARQKDANAKLFPEPVVNVMGYEHLQASDTKGAIEIFKLNADAFPHSPNVYDSLSDAYLADGQKNLARDNAKKALEVLASDKSDDQQRIDAIRASAEGKLKQLGDPTK